MDPNILSVARKHASMLHVKFLYDEAYRRDLKLTDVEFAWSVLPPFAAVRLVVDVLQVVLAFFVALASAACVAVRMPLNTPASRTDSLLIELFFVALTGLRDHGLAMLVDLMFLIFGWFLCPLFLFLSE